MMDRLCQRKSVADTAGCPSPIALPVVGPRRGLQLPKTVLRGGGRAGQETSGSPCGHHVSSSARNNQQPSLQPRHLPTTDCASDVRVRCAGGDNVPPQQHPSSRSKNFCRFHHATMSAPRGRRQAPAAPCGQTSYPDQPSFRVAGTELARSSGFNCLKTGPVLEDLRRSVHPAEVQDQFRVAVGLQDHRDAPVLLVEVAGGVVGDLAVLGLGAVARGGAGGNVQHALRHVR